MIPPLIVIPARLKSTRLPRKPLAQIGDKPMILHVLEKAQQANLGPVWVACAEQEIKDVVQRAGGNAVLTDPQLPSGSDRVCQALQTIDPQKKYLHIINLQGDMPGCEPQALQLLSNMMNNADLSWDIATLASSLTDEGETRTDSVVKIATALTGKIWARALYFSREPIPWGADARWKHLGIYGWRRESLEKFVKMPRTLLEEREKLEQLRALENGMTIICAAFETKSFSVDTADDLKRMREKFTSGR